MPFARLMIMMGMAVLASPAVRAADPPPRLSYVALNAYDEKRALEFYKGVLGMVERRRITPKPALTEILLGFTQDSSDPGVLLVMRGGRIPSQPTTARAWSTCQFRPSAARLRTKAFFAEPLPRRRSAALPSSRQRYLMTNRSSLGTITIISIISIIKKPTSGVTMIVRSNN